MSFVVLHVANFALQAVARAEPALEDWAMALLLDRSKKATVVEANAAARAAGVEIGFTAPQAMARCAAIVLRVRSPAAEAEAEAALIAIAKSLSPRAERTAPGICTVDLAGRPADTYGALGCEAVERLRSFGLAATAGIARTPLLALYAAHQAQPVLEVGDERVFLAALPLALADPAPALEAILEGWGIVTLGAFTALPKSDISRRLGQAGVDLWERAAGEADRPIESLPAEESFEAAMDWEQEIETLEPLLFILRRFVDRLALQLANAGLVAAKLSLELRLADETFYRREFRLPEPAGDPEILFRALHTHLETLHTGAAIAGAKLALSPTRPLVRQGGIFEAGLRDPHGFAETLARVEAIVGSSGVGTPCPEATHRPDAFALEKPAAVVGAMPAPPVLPPLGLPLRRFRPPLAAGVESDGPAPVGVRCDAVRGRVRCARGPWRGSGDWWKPERWDREEWDVELEDGGIFRLCRTAGRWWVEGMYD